MKFFLMILTFTPCVFAEGVLAPHVTHVMEDAEEVMAQRARAVQDVMEDAERIMAQRTQGIRLISQRPQWKNLTPEVNRIDLVPRIQWINPLSQQAEIEMYREMSVMGKHLSALIVSGDGAFCELSQDPLQCCNTFAKDPDQCLFEKIEKGLLTSSSLSREGVCDKAQNREGCASQVESSVLLQLVTQQGKDVNLTKVMELRPYGIEEAKSGVRFPIPPACAKPQSSECMEILEMITSMPGHNFSGGDEGSSDFSIMDYPSSREKLPSDIKLFREYYNLKEESSK